MFDRDSLFTLHYDVNFLYILKLYAQNKSYSKNEWKLLVREKFRENILAYLNDHYNFYQVMIKGENIKGYVDRNFRKLVGKVFSFKDINNNDVLLYAERKGQNDHDSKAYKFDSAKHAYIDSIDGKSWIAIPNEKKYLVDKITLGYNDYKAVDKDNIKEEKEYNFEKDDLKCGVVSESTMDNVKNYRMEEPQPVFVAETSDEIDGYKKK